MQRVNPEPHHTFRPITQSAVEPEEAAPCRDITEDQAEAQAKTLQVGQESLVKADSMAAQVQPILVEAVVEQVQMGLTL